MYDRPSGPLSGQRLIAILAVVGLAWFVIGSLQPGPSRISMWGGQNPFAQGKAAGQSAPVAQGGGITGQTVAQAGRGLGGGLVPEGNPLRDAKAVMTQGYGVGSHAPADAWGAIDLAIDGDGDGSADPQGSLGRPIYATHAGVVKVTPNSVPAGNHVWVINDEYKTGYSHLAGFAVESGQQVQAGDLIGYLGSTGQSSGPHLDYQVWKMVNGSWVNQNPLDYGGADR